MPALSGRSWDNADTGTQKSGSWAGPGSGLTAMPTTVNACGPRRTVRPTSSGSRPNCVVQARWDTTATAAAAFGSSSDGASRRPCAGAAPSTVKKLPDTRATFTRVGPPPATSVKSNGPKVASENASAPAARNCRYSGWLSGEKRPSSNRSCSVKSRSAPARSSGRQKCRSTVDSTTAGMLNASASVSTTVAANTRRPASERNARRRSPGTGIDHAGRGDAAPSCSVTLCLAGLDKFESQAAAGAARPNFRR